MKTMRSSRDLSKDDIFGIMEKAKACEEGKGKSLEGKIIGVLTFRPSLRTTAAIMHAALKSGAGYIPLDASYVKTGEEDLEDTVRGVSGLVDILTIRTPMTVDISDLKSEVPIINLMCGDEHTIAMLWFFYSLYKRGVKLEGMKIGVYGNVKYSQPTIGLYRMGAKLGMHFYEDPVVDAIGSDEKLQNEIKELGGTWERKARDEFINEVDMMWISEGHPGEGADKETMGQYLEKYEVTTKETMKKSRPECYWEIVESRHMPDHRLTAEKETDDHPMLLNQHAMREGVFVTRAVFEWMLTG